LFAFVFYTIIIRFIFSCRRRFRLFIAGIPGALFLVPFFIQLDLFDPAIAIRMNRTIQALLWL
jgi:hypothetical protein